MKIFANAFLNFACSCFFYARAEGAGIPEDMICSMTVPVTGRSPGSNLGRTEEDSLQKCQARCVQLEGCWAITYRPHNGYCFALDRTYNGDYQHATGGDDVEVSNKICSKRLYEEAPKESADSCEWNIFYDKWLPSFSPGVYEGNGPYSGAHCLQACCKDPSCEGLAMESSLQYQCYKYAHMPDALNDNGEPFAEFSIQSRTPRWSILKKKMAASDRRQVVPVNSLVRQTIAQAANAQSETTREQETNLDQTLRSALSAKKINNQEDVTPPRSKSKLQERQLLPFLCQMVLLIAFIYLISGRLFTALQGWQQIFVRMEKRAASGAESFLIDEKQRETAEIFRQDAISSDNYATLRGHSHSEMVRAPWDS